MSEVTLYEGEYIDDLQRNGFRIIQRKDIFRFGTDSVLLSDFAGVKKRDNVADLGCGNGAISLIMLAKNPYITVTGVEIQPDVAAIARRNAKLNDVEDRFTVINEDMRSAHIVTGYGKFSLAVCNPPYFASGAALLSENESKRISRHEGDITPFDIAASAFRLLKTGGRFALIYPAPRALEMLRALEDNRLAPKRIRTVHGIAGRAPKHILIEAVKDGGQSLHWLPPLDLKNKDGSYTDEWHRIYD